MNECGKALLSSFLTASCRFFSTTQNETLWVIRLVYRFESWTEKVSVIIFSNITYPPYFWVAVETALLPSIFGCRFFFLEPQWVVGWFGWCVEGKVPQKQSVVSCFQHNSASGFLLLLKRHCFLNACRFFSQTRMGHCGWIGSFIDLKLGRKQSVLSYFQHNSVLVFVNECGKKALLPTFSPSIFIFFLNMIWLVYGCESWT